VVSVSTLEINKEPFAEETSESQTNFAIVALDSGRLRLHNPPPRVISMLNRRNFLAICSTFGFAGTLFPGVLWAMAQDQKEEKITAAMIEQAAKIADVPIPADDISMMLSDLNQATKGYDEIYALHMANGIQPAMIFDPLTTTPHFEPIRRPMRISEAPAIAARGVPKDLEEIAFSTIRELAELVRTKKVSSSALTDMYLARLKRYDPLLKFVITFTEDRAHAQAKEADHDIAAGKYRGPLHGIPWGAKDLLAVKGYPTTWGAMPYKDQTIDEDAEVVKRLDKAGAVLVAKLTLGALAEGDHWFGGITRNPWNPDQGSSGSSAGPASATAAGCVGFGVGSETLGSISSPSTRCGCTGLRPTFGHVPRTGAMALSWSQDKLGPLCRAVEDCALVLDAIAGPDGTDRSVQPAAFNWNANLNWRKLRVAYLKSEFAFDRAALEARLERFHVPDEQKQRALASAEYDQKFNDAALKKLGEMGVQMTPVEFPKMPYQAMVTILAVEGAAAFDELTRTGRDKLMVDQGPQAWPNTFRTARFVPAVEYVQANRAKFLLMQGVEKALAGFDVIVAPTNGDQLTVTNLTGHPAVILPTGFRGDDAPAAVKGKDGMVGNYGGPGTPVSLTFLGQLYGEAKMLALARAYQNATPFHLRHPKLPA
jgi:Asp-tRNA(Asn)/Glu-tRNA(Gln) amidotransferase A subunit family amidase